MQFFAGDRASDVGRVLVQEIKILSDGSGLILIILLVRQCVGMGNLIGLLLKAAMIVTVKGIERYLHDAKLYGIDLSFGYVLHPVLGAKTVLNESISYSAIYERLKTYLSVLGIDSGETPHSMRAGCAVTLAMSGKVKTREMMDHIGWSSGKSAEYYSRSAKFFDSGIVAQELTSAQQVETEYQVNADFTNLQRLCDL